MNQRIIKVLIILISLNNINFSDMDILSGVIAILLFAYVVFITKDYYNNRNVRWNF